MLGELPGEHRRGAPFRLFAVAGDMRGRQCGLGRELGIDFGFVLPNIDDTMQIRPMGQPRQQGGFVHHAAAAGVDQHRAGPQPLQRGGIEQMAGRMPAAGGQWHMQADDIAIEGVRQRAPDEFPPRPAEFRQWWIANHNFMAEFAHPAGEPATDGAGADHADAWISGFDAAGEPEAGDGAEAIFDHGPSVGAAAMGQGDAIRAEPFAIDMIKAAGGGADKAHAGVPQQRAVHGADRAHQQGVGVD